MNFNEYSYGKDCDLDKVYQMAKLVMDVLEQPLADASQAYTDLMLRHGKYFGVCPTTRFDCALMSCFCKPILDRFTTEQIQLAYSRLNIGRLELRHHGNRLLSVHIVDLNRVCTIHSFFGIERIV